jgi:hypothetical protein
MNQRPHGQESAARAFHLSLYRPDIQVNALSLQNKSFIDYCQKEKKQESISEGGTGGRGKE